MATTKDQAKDSPSPNSIDLDREFAKQRETDARRSDAAGHRSVDHKADSERRRAAPDPHARAPEDQAESPPQGEELPPRLAPGAGPPTHIPPGAIASGLTDHLVAPAFGAPGQAGDVAPDQEGERAQRRRRHVAAMAHDAWRGRGGNPAALWDEAEKLYTTLERHDALDHLDQHYGRGGQRQRDEQRQREQREHEQRQRDQQDREQRQHGGEHGKGSSKA